MAEVFRWSARALALLGAIGVLACASGARAGEKWDPIPAEQLGQPRGLVDPDADAEVLHWKVFVEDWYGEKGMVSDRRHHVRVKVFTGRGAQQWSRIQIDQPDGAEVKITDLEARTVLPDGTTRHIAPGALSTETVVRTRKTRRVRVSCALSGVEPGAIVEYRYNERWIGTSALVGYYPLQFDHPAQEILYSIRPLEASGVRFRMLVMHAPDVPPGKLAAGFAVVRSGKRQAFRHEPDMPPREQELPFAVSFYTKPGDYRPEAYWPQVGRERALAFEEATRPDAAIRRAAEEAVQRATNDSERVERIARWVSERFRAPGHGGPDSTRAARSRLRPAGSAAEALRQGGGTHDDILAIFASMLRAVGLDPRLVLAPSREALFFHRSMTMESLLDSRLVALRLDGEWRVFDPATGHLAWDMLEWDVEGVSALLCDRDSVRFIDTPQAPPERSALSRHAELELAPDGSLAGTVRWRAEGHENQRLRDRLQGMEDTASDSLARELNDPEGGLWRVSDVRLHNPGVPREPLQMEARVEIPGYAAVTGKRMLLEPSVFRARNRPRYTSSEREHPVYYEYAWCDLDTVRIRLPEGWVLEDHDVLSPLFAEGVADYVADVRVSEDGRTLTYVRRFRMGLDGSIYIPVEYYLGVKQLFDGIRARDGVVLSLKRVSEAP